MLTYHQHNEHEITLQLVQRLKHGEQIAMISDSGTPGISDAGYLLIRECLKEQVAITCLPGPTAFVPALLVSGFPVNEFVFAGFLPQKKGRQTRLKALSSENRTILFYESPNRLQKLLEELLQAFGASRMASVSREISKLYEETQRGTLMELCAHYKEKQVKGEIVVVVQGLI